MAERDAERSGMFWSLVAWGAALVAGIVVIFLVAMVGGMAAGLIFGGVAFVVTAWVLSRYLGPPADDAGAGYAHAHAAHPVAPGHVHEPVGHPAVHRGADPVVPDPAVVATPVAPVPTPEPIIPGSVAPAPVAPEPAPAPDMGPGAAISERVREAARAAGAAARAALGDGDEVKPQPLTGTPGGAVSQPATLAAPEGAPDDLRRLKGVGPKLAELLNAKGIFHFRQIAAWGPGEVAWIEENIEVFPGRVARDDWVGQARVLADGGETEHSQRVDRGEST